MERFKHRKIDCTLWISSDRVSFYLSFKAKREKTKKSTAINHKKKKKKKEMTVGNKEMIVITVVECGSE